MQNWEFFYFLWDDPLFTESIGDPQDYVSDPEFIAFRRAERLLALELLYIKIETLRRELRNEKQFHREAQAREVWTINQFSKHVSSDTAEQILIDRKVLGMDRDFSFEKAIAGSESTPNS
jgi:hypothetical protein